MSTSTLVTTFWLRKHIDRLRSTSNKLIRVLDATFLHERDTYDKFYKKGHIPGARFFDLNKCVHSSLIYPRNLPEPMCFESYLQKLGIHQDTHVVAYDQFDMRDAARVWWLLRAYGHKRVSVLDGGYKKWKADGLDVDTDELQHDESRVKIGLNRDLVRSFTDMMDIIKTKDHIEQICDARASSHFEGSSKEPIKDMHHGHMPGARNIQFSDLVERISNYYMFKSSEEIMKVFLRGGIDLNRPIVATCQSGVLACSVALAAELVGMKDVPVYYGAWLEWSTKVKETLVEAGDQMAWFTPCTDPNCRYCRTLGAPGQRLNGQNGRND